MADASTRRIANHDVRSDPTINEVRQAIADGASAVLGMAHFDSLFRTEPDGTIRVPDIRRERFFGGHAVFVAGYDDRRGAVLVRNSWGVRWGDGGYGWLPYTYPETLLRHLWLFRL